MKVKVISRNLDDYRRETNQDIHKLVRNYNTGDDPFQAQTEYVRALNATKLERDDLIGCADDYPNLEVVHIRSQGSLRILDLDRWTSHEGNWGVMIALDSLSTQLVYYLGLRRRAPQCRRRKKSSENQNRLGGSPYGMIDAVVSASCLRGLLRP